MPDQRIDDQLNLLTFEESRRIVGVSHPVFRRWIQSGEIMTVKLFGTKRRRVPRFELERFIRQLMTVAKDAE